MVKVIAYIFRGGSASALRVPLCIILQKQFYLLTDGRIACPTVNITQNNIRMYESPADTIRLPLALPKSSLMSHSEAILALETMLVTLGCPVKVRTASKFAASFSGLSDGISSNRKGKIISPVTTIAYATDSHDVLHCGKSSTDMDKELRKVHTVLRCCICTRQQWLLHRVVVQREQDSRDAPKDV